MKLEIRTFISPVIIGGDLGEKAGEELLKDGQPVCWLDCLLGGGIHVPEGVIKKSERPLLWLVSGPHGSGKTIFGMELCYRLASRSQPKPMPAEPAGRMIRWLGKKINTVLYSRESSTGRIKENMQSLGWDWTKASSMRVFGEEVLGARGAEPRTMFQEICSDEGLRPAEGVEGGVVVLDGLGSFMTETEIIGLVDEISRLSCGKVWLLVLILDLRKDGDLSDTLADRADILTKFTETSDGDYSLRQVRIVKMRFQEHVQGDHIVKVYGKPLTSVQLSQARTPAVDHIGLKRNEGGLYVLPSIHRHLSGGMRGPGLRSHTGVPAPVEHLEDILPLGTGSLKGFPKGGCTAFVGVRGGLKSYLAYLTMLKHLLTDTNALGIMLSLRDDVDGTLLSLKTICDLEGIGSQSWLKDVTSTKSRRLLVEYFWPGYIPPSEFMHRVVVATEGMLRFNPGTTGQNLIVVMNGLDHLNARHPLCAREEMFVPAIISYFQQHNSSIFVVAATEPEPSLSLVGLEPMADCLLKFSVPKEVPPAIKSIGKQFIEVMAKRVPAGGIGRSKGILFRYDPFPPPAEQGKSASDKEKRKGQLLFHTLTDPV